MKLIISAFSPLTILFFIFLTSILFSNKYNLVGAMDHYYETCRVTKSYGNQTINFPFYIQGQQEPYCGYPGFNLSCDDGGRPIINLSGQNYIVRKIFYENQSIIVSNAVFLNSENVCIPSIRNLSLPDHLAQVSNQSRVFLFHNCRSSSLGTPLKNRIGCYTGNYTNSVLAFYENNKDELVNSFEKCGTGAVIVVAEYRNGNENEGIVMREVLKSGFMLKWKASNCSYCESSGGRCGFDLNSYHFKCYCPDRPHAARCGPPGKSGDTKAAIMIATSVAEIGILIAVILCLLRKKSSNASIFFWKKQNQTYENVEAFLRNYGPLQVRRYRFSDIKKMTNSFKEKLGQGGFGNVYKGKIEENCLVAVKVLNQSNGDDGHEFINEVATISKTSHVNVVTLLGFCFEGVKRAIIYEFMPNGSLEKFIFHESTIENSCHLNWDTQYELSLGIARGLEYLHCGCNTRILHLDIKPHNILLDADFVPKISDFGLAKMCTRKDSLISMLVPRGTVGYIAPEVFNRNFGGISHKSDVYSYGMMILEMVGGRNNINVRVDNTSDIYFPHWIYKQLELDEELGLKRITHEETRVKVKKMIIVSLWCIQTDPSNRPAMSTVLEMLEVPPKPFLYSP